VSKLSPINDTLEMCVKHVDSSNIEDLVERLVEVVKRGVGMSTRVGYVGSVVLIVCGCDVDACACLEIC